MHITSHYGWRRLTLNGRTFDNFHNGVDLRSPQGGEVRALFAGIVRAVRSGRAHGAGVGKVSNGVSALTPTTSGNGLLIERPDGTAYVEIHMAPTVKVGDTVQAGDLIGHTDTSGTITAAHRHVELWTDPANPYSRYDPTPEIEGDDDMQIDELVNFRIDGRNLWDSLRDIRALTEHSRNLDVQQAAQLAALAAAVDALATANGLDPAEVKSTIDQAVRAALEGLAITLATVTP